MQEMTTFQRLRLEANFSLNGLARAADVDYKTARKADKGLQVQPLKARALLRVLSNALRRQVEENEIVEWNRDSDRASRA